MQTLNCMYSPHLQKIFKLYLIFISVTGISQISERDIMNGELVVTIKSEGRRGGVIGTANIPLSTIEDRPYDKKRFFFFFQFDFFSYLCCHLRPKTTINKFENLIYLFSVFFVCVFFSCRLQQRSVSQSSLVHGVFANLPSFFFFFPLSFSS
jgi:hypothetical protein